MGNHFVTSVYNGTLFDRDRINAAGNRVYLFGTDIA